MKVTALIRPALALALPLLVAGCGVTDIFGTNDMGVAACPGITIYKVVPGMYTITSVTNITDGCQTGLTPAVLQNMTRQVDNNNGTLTLHGSTGLDYGTGAFRCNMTASGTPLNFGPVATNDGMTCNYMLQRQSTVSIVNNSDIVANVLETQTVRTGASCVAQGSCTTSWTMELRM